MNGSQVDASEFLSRRARQLDGSGARLLFELQEKISNPVDLSIGQPDFDVPDKLKDAVVLAIREGANGYTHPQGVPALREKLISALCDEFPEWAADAGSPEGVDAMATSGVTAGLVLALASCIEPGDEVLIPEPYFMSYRHLAVMFGATPVCVDTYPDFEITAERIEAHLSPRTKLLFFNSPGNPTGAVASEDNCRAVAELADRSGFLILADEVYSDFCFRPMLRGGRWRAPSVASFTRNVILLRGLSKTCGMTGWRIGFAAGPHPIIQKMSEAALLYYVCPPSMVQAASIAALDHDPAEVVERYRQNRDLIVETLSGVYDVTPPEGAFYAFIPVPEHLGMTGTQLVTKAVLGRQTLMVPGAAFSGRDTHFRISFACDSKTLERGLEVILALATVEDPVSIGVGVAPMGA